MEGEGGYGLEAITYRYRGPRFLSRSSLDDVLWGAVGVSVTLRTLPTLWGWVDCRGSSCNTHRYRGPTRRSYTNYYSDRCHVRSIPQGNVSTHTQSFLISFFVIHELLTDNNVYKKSESLKLFLIIEVTKWSLCHWPLKHALQFVSQKIIAKATVDNRHQGQKQYIP